MAVNSAGSLHTWEPDDWENFLKKLPTEPWDFYTDYPRLASNETNAHLQSLATVYLKLEAVDDEVTLLVAFCAALGAYGHGRDVIWVLDSAAGADPLPLSASLSGSTLLQLQEHLTAERSRLRGMRRAAGVAEAIMVLRRAAPPGRFSAQGAHPVCQVAFGREPPGEPPPDFVLRCASGSDSVSLGYRADLYDETTAHSLARHIVALVDQRASWASMQLDQLQKALFTEEERELLMKFCSGPTTDLAGVQFVHEMFERRAKDESADSTAVIPGDDSIPAWSYRKLDASAGEISLALAGLGLNQAGGRVALLIQRCPAMIAAIYGILRAGQAYVPLDVAWPVQRQCVVIEDVDASALVVGQEQKVPTSCRGLPSVRLSADGRPEASSNFVPACVMLPLPRPEPEMSVYILYTSGTTGKPKGVNVPHLGLAGRTAWLQRTWPLGASQTVAQKTPITFAISEWELFWPLCYGARLALAEDARHGDAHHIAWLLESRSVTHAVFVPSLLDQLLEELDGSALPNLRCLICCGEALRPPTIRSASAGLPSAEIVNLYGPTEGSMTMLRYGSPLADKDLLRFPIGVPIDNTMVICSWGSAPELDLSPLLFQGELGFAGPLIASGYWGLPAVTQEKFVKNPYAQGQVYRTGDLGRWRADGTLEFLGRVDQQVKFNGVRIELGEIESVLQSLPGVTAASAFLDPPHLVAACSAASSDHKNGQLEQHLLEELRQRLPKHTVPTRILVLNELPLTERSKIDRKQLLEISERREEERKRLIASMQVEPLSSSEQRIAELVQDLLGVSEVLSASAGFQQLGFSSLQLGRLTSRVRRAFALPGLPATAVYQYPTLGQLASHIDETRGNDETDSSQPLVLASQLWRGSSSTSWFSLICQSLGMLCQSLIYEFAFLPAYYILWHIYVYHSISGLLIALPPVLLLDVVFTLIVFVIMKWVIVGKRRTGDFPIFGTYYWKWWLMHSLEHYVEEHMTHYIVDTVLYSIFLRCLGAQIGSGVRVNKCHLSDVDLIRLDDHVRIERGATLCPSRLWCGTLQLRPIHVCKGSYVAARAFMAGGTTLPESMELTPMASSDKFGAHHMVPHTRERSLTSFHLDCLQLFLGQPLLMLAEGLSDIPVVLALIGVWKWLVNHLITATVGGAPLGEAFAKRGKWHGGQGWQKGSRWGWGMFHLRKEGYTLEKLQRVLYPFILSIPWVMTLIHGFSYFFLVVVLKKFVIGKFSPGPASSVWDQFRRWLLERLLTSSTYHDFMELWVNTEVLSCWYRLLGAKVAMRVNMDFFAAVEFDLIEIERDVVFGSSVLLRNTEHGVSKSIKLRQGACVLDNSCVLPGSSIPEGALLGSFTVVPQGTELEAMTVYTGCENGTCVRLFQRPLLPGEKVVGQTILREQELDENNAGTRQVVPLAPAALQQRQLEALALQRHRSTFWFVLFNVWCIACAVVFAPLPDVVYWATIIIDFEVYDLFKDSDYGEVVSVALMAPIYIAVTGLMLIAVALLKWILIGRWTPGDRPYYTWFHFRWSALMVVFTCLSDLQAQIAGTWLAVLFMRLMGAKVGKKVCFFGHGFEFDLLHIGDEVCIGADCDVTAHTVENMVMKMEVVKFESGSSCMTGSVVMPGGQMEPWSTLIEHSQVLKGETVPQGCCFGGLPAKLRPNYPLLDEVQLPDVAPEAGQEPLLGGSAASARTYRQQIWESGTEMRQLGELEAAGDTEFLEYQTDNESDSETAHHRGWHPTRGWRLRTRRLLNRMLGYRPI